MLTYQKTLAFGFTGGKFAYWTENFYNKCDIVATFGYGVEVVLSLLAFTSTNVQVLTQRCPPQAFVFLSVAGSSFFTLRGLKLLRLLKPLGQLVLFSDLETVFDTIKKAIAPMVR
jgi:hypothetical protein